MDITITPRALSGYVDGVPSKSVAHRLLICAALSSAPTRLICRGTSRDIEATADCLSALGATLKRDEEGFIVSPISSPISDAILPCGESGSTLRFILPVVGALGAKVRLSLCGRLPSRPIEPLWSELSAHGMRLSRDGEDTILCEGSLVGGDYSLPADISSQFISGLLFALPLLSEDSTLTLSGKRESAPYIAMTEDALRTFGIRFTYRDNTYFIPGRQTPVFAKDAPLLVEGDWSGAAFFLAAGALGEGICCRGLSATSLQGDKEILSLLSRFGAKTSCTENGISVQGAPLHALSIDASQIPDLVPILAVCAAAAQGTTRIFGAARLRLKESDRLSTVSAMLRALGGSIEETDDGLIIEGGRALSGGTVDSAGDHRIAMSAAIASMLCRGPVTIRGAEAPEKSYPAFWEHFALCGGLIEGRETP